LDGTTDVSAVKPKAAVGSGLISDTGGTSVGAPNGLTSAARRLNGEGDFFRSADFLDPPLLLRLFFFFFFPFEVDPSDELDDDEEEDR